MFFVTHKKVFFIVTGVIVALALGAVAVLGVRFGIDFTGGTLLEVTYPAGRPDKAAVEEQLSALPIGGYSLRPTDDSAYLLRSKDLSEEERADVMRALSLNETMTVETVRLNTIGPVVGEELKNKAFVALGIVAIVIVLFVAYAFRRPSDPEEEEGAKKKKKDTTEVEYGVSSFTYGYVAIIALLHDILVPVGVFAVLGAILGAEIDILFVMALLAILGYSVNDTIVVMDRVRENLRNNQERNVLEPFQETVGRSLDQTIARSINTSLTTLLVLLALMVWGGEATRYFALTLMAGVVAGTYSSIALASPLLVVFHDRAEAKRQAQVAAK